MKKILSLMTILLAVSCARIEQDVTDGTSRLTVSINNALKTGLSDKDGSGVRRVLWKEGDKISVNGVLSESLSDEYDGQTSAVFEFSSALSAPLRILYPGQSTDGVIAMPSTQTYAAGSFDPAAAPMYASGNTTSSIKMNSLAGILRFGFTGTQTLDRIELKTAGGELIAGNVTLEQSAGLFTGNFSITSGGKSEIVLSFGKSGLTLSGSPASIFVPVLSGSYASGFEAKAITKAGEVMTLRFFGSGRTITASKVLEFPDKAFVAGSVLTLVEAGTYDSEDVELEDTKEIVIKRPDSSSLASYNVYVNGTACAVLTKPSGAEYVSVPVDPSGKYFIIAMPTTKSSYFNGSVAIIPRGQFPDAVNTLTEMPYAATLRSGSNITLHPAYSVLNLNVSGSGSLESLKADATGGVSGKLSFTSKGAAPSFAKSTGPSVVNLTNGGTCTPLSASGTVIPVIVAPGTYSDLKVTMVGKDHRVCIVNLPEMTLTSGQTKSIDIEYEPDENIVFYTDFDLFVWGGDVMSGIGSLGYAPNSVDVTSSNETSRTGLEYAFTERNYSKYGSAYIQSDYGKKVSEVRTMSESYCNSRNIMDYSLFRVQELPGYVAVGTAEKKRGQFYTPAFTNINGIADVEVEFDFCYMYGASDNILPSIQKAGALTGIEIDGVAQTLNKDNFTFVVNCSPYCEFTHDRTSVSQPSSASAAKTWHHAKIYATGVSAVSSFCIMGATASNSDYHGFYLDNIRVKIVNDRTTKASGVTRLLYWNIQNGMWAGQGDNYKKFVAWVKKYDPDICVWCEAKSNYKYSGISGSLDWNNSNWATLAARYGHSYATPTGSRVMGSGDNYPQEVTSKYTISGLNNYTYSAYCYDTTGVKRTLKSHGGGHVKITVGGHTLNIVPLHLVPGTVYSTENIDAYQGGEIKSFYEASVLNSKYASQTDWIVVGDHNCQTPQDKWHYGEGFKRYTALTYVRDNTDMRDVIDSKYPGYFFSSTQGGGRIDYVYLSPSLMSKVDYSMIIFDDFANPVTSSVSSSYSDPSDHRPILVDFKF